MSRLNEFESRFNEINASVDATIQKAEKIAAESRRVADVAKNAPQIIANLEEEFEQRTRIQKQDIAFLFLATALQCCRQYLLTDFKDRLGDQEAAGNTLGEKTFDPHTKDRDDRKHRYYNPSLEEIIQNPVPFDAQAGNSNFGVEVINPKSGKSEIQGPLKGYGKFAHRGATLGHDTILGWIFGTANIATSTLTTSKFQSYHISSNNKNDYFSANASTAKVLYYTQDKLLHQGFDGKLIIATSLVKEAVHLMSDVNSKNSLPLPIFSTFNPKLANDLAKYGLDMANVINVGKQAAMAEAINLIIAMLHRLTFNLDSESDRKLFEVRTRRVILCSNGIATASNVIAVAIGSAIGVATDNPDLVKKSLKKLDIGGFLVTMHHLLTDRKFIRDVKQEFILNNFDKLIQGDE